MAHVPSQFMLKTALTARGAATRVGGFVFTLAVALSGCQSERKPEKSSSAQVSASAYSAPAPVASGLPIPVEDVSHVVNPKNEAEYKGPTATVRGVVRASGDPAPEQSEVLAKIPAGCDAAREMYARLFREGSDRQLADVLVAVTGYRGYVPARGPKVVVEASGCAWSGRTIAVTFGQQVEVKAKDRRAYVPDLVGGKMPAQLIAMPGGDGSALYPTRPGRYLLVDSMRLFTSAEVIVLKYSTFDVTGLDGAFEISGIPAGEVTVNAVLPATGVTVEQKVTLAPGEKRSLNFEIAFDAALHAQTLEASTRKPAASASAPPPALPSAAPSAR